jgi:hypothetical protein
MAFLTEMNPGAWVHVTQAPFIHPCFSPVPAAQVDCTYGPVEPGTSGVKISTNKRDLHRSQDRCAEVF